MLVPATAAVPLYAVLHAGQLRRQSALAPLVEHEGVRRALALGDETSVSEAVVDQVRHRRRRCISALGGDAVVAAFGNDPRRRNGTDPLLAGGVLLLERVKRRGSMKHTIRCIYSGQLAVVNDFKVKFIPASNSKNIPHGLKLHSTHNRRRVSRCTFAH